MNMSTKIPSFQHDQSIQTHVTKLSNFIIFSLNAEKGNPRNPREKSKSL